MLSSFLSLFIDRRTIPQQVKTHQLIWEEYLDGNNEKQAYLNIVEKLGIDSISRKTIKNCYKRFRSGDYSFFKGYQISPVIQTLLDGTKVKYQNINSYSILERHCELNCICS